MIDYQNPKVIKVAKVKCLQSILFHTRYFFSQQYNRKFVIGEHHEIICDALERVLSGKLLRLIINIAPRYGKTELAVKSFISHGLALNPAAKFIHLSYGDDIALDNSEMVKDLIQTPAYQQLFPDVQIKHGSKAKDKWYTTLGGGVLARAAGGQVTGFGAGLVDQEIAKAFEETGLDDFTPEGNEVLGDKFTFGGAIIIDDPIKPEDADQDTIREKVNSRFDSTIRNRVNSRNTPIIVIMQRLHPNDLAGYLQRTDEADKWEVIKLPCIKEDGTALWPFKHTLDELKRLERSNDLVFGRQYQQDPKPKTGLLFPIQDLQFADMDSVPGIDDPDFVYLPADPADEGGDDFAAGPFKLVGSKIYVTDILYNTDGTDLNEKAFAQMCKVHKPSEVGVEGVLGWRETAKRIKEDLNDKGYEGEFRILKPRIKKHTRITNRASFIRNHFVFRKDWEDYPQYAKFIRNLTSYLKIQEAGKGNKHDDAPDLCEMAAVYFEKNFPHLWGMQ